MAVRIQDIADALQTSCGTVSRALRDDGRISEQTRKRVRKLADELGYRPSHAATVLKTGKTGMVSIVVPDLTNPFFVEVARRIETHCAGRQYQSMIFETVLEASRERKILERMLDRRCDGVISVVTRYEPIRDVLDEFWTRKIPCIIPGLPMDRGETPLDGLSVDLSVGVGLAVDHLAELGHKHMVFMASWSPETGDSGRHVGWEQALKRHHLPIDKNPFVSRFTGNQLRDGYEATRELFDRDPSVTAIVGVNDFFVMGAIRALTERGLSVPRDVSVIGTDNTWIGQNWPVALTTIDQKTEEQASRVSRMLFERIKADTWDEPLQEVVESTLIVRESTGPVRSSARA